MGGDTACTATLAARLWPKMAAEYVSRVLQPQLQRLGNDASALEQATARAVSLEGAAADLGMVGHGAPLASAAKHALDALLHSQRAAIVAQARAALLAADVRGAGVRVGEPLPLPQHPPPCHDSPPEDAALDWGPPGEEAPLTATGQYSVSPAALRLEELVALAVQQGADSGSAATAHSMCTAVADMAILVATVPPVLRV